MRNLIFTYPNAELVNRLLIKDIDTGRLGRYLFVYNYIYAHASVFVGSR